MTSHLKSLNIKKTMTYYAGNPGLVLWQIIEKKTYMPVQIQIKFDTDKQSVSIALAIYERMWGSNIFPPLW